MYRKRTIKLIKETYTTDLIGQRVPTETAKEYIAEVDSVSRSEFYQAGQIGLTPEYRFKLNKLAYNGEKIVEYNGIRYGVYRTYESSPYTIELYVERKGGV